ncbi:MAG: hypothetical protein QOJ15_10143 [Bradyrhizobium sp.]|nr:hypothetical protein [Bradyrhizobium sp.]
MRNVFDVLVLEAGFDVLRHDVAHERLRPFAFGNRVHRDIAVCDLPDQAIVVADRQQPASISANTMAACWMVCSGRAVLTNDPGVNDRSWHDRAKGEATVVTTAEFAGALPGRSS